jgi:hypothetical protein
MAPAWLTVVAWVYLSICFGCAGVIGYDIGVKGKGAQKSPQTGQRTPAGPGCLMITCHCAGPSR